MAVSTPIFANKASFSALFKLDKISSTPFQIIANCQHFRIVKSELPAQFRQHSSDEEDFAKLRQILCRFAEFCNTYFDERDITNALLENLINVIEISKEVAAHLRKIGQKAIPSLLQMVIRNFRIRIEHYHFPWSLVPETAKGGARHSVFH